MLDASVLIAHLANDDIHGSEAFEILDTEEELAIHPFTLAECLVGPARLGRAEEALAIIERLGVEQVAVPPGQSLALARLRASTRLKLPDCCVLAAVLETSARVATFDAALADAAKQLGIAVAA